MHVQIILPCTYNMLCQQKWHLGDAPRVHSQGKGRGTWGTLRGSTPRAKCSWGTLRGSTPRSCGVQGDEMAMAAVQRKRAAEGLYYLFICVSG